MWLMSVRLVIIIKSLKYWRPVGCRKVEEVGNMWIKITIAAYVYVFILKKLKDHIKSSKYYETANLKTGGPCWHYSAQLSARAIMQPLECYQDFLSFCLLTIFEHGLDIINTNILTKFQAAEANNAAFRVLTIFPFNLA